MKRWASPKPVTSVRFLLPTFQTLHSDIVQQMDKNTKLDMQFIHDSQNRYEMEYRQRAATLDKCMSEAWRMERQRDRNLHNMKEKVNMLHSDMLSFVRDSQRAADLEEKRRYRFLAEKHLMLCTSFMQYHSRAQGVLSARVPVWKEQIEASRAQAAPPSQGQNYPFSHSTTNQRDSMSMTPRSVADVLSMVNRAEQNSGRAGTDTSKRGLQRTSSGGSTGNYRARSSSFGEVAVAAVVAAAAGGGNKKVQAVVDHRPGGNPTMLPFSKGDTITILVPEARNGWLYGKHDTMSGTGWFPEAYVVPFDATQSSSRPGTLRSAHSASDLLDDNAQPPANRHSQRRNGPAPAPPPPPPSGNNVKERTPVGLRAELFPKGTNPFATVKLRPTVTDDRSAPIIR
ncbi:BAR/IMD domain-containing adapter protein 2-like 2 isoform X1 [Hyperolius riggenbachi]|uniref:BAR/IMD domain-containing adapter protein 2-like 2 isoform X1 n=1 Tax=Hyperolius riggenbachi TaxID=752182 RepID=UPI0035A29C2E